MSYFPTGGLEILQGGVAPTTTSTRTTGFSSTSIVTGGTSPVLAPQPSLLETIFGKIKDAAAGTPLEALIPGPTPEPATDPNAPPLEDHSRAREILTKGGGFGSIYDTPGLTGTGTGQKAADSVAEYAIEYRRKRKLFILAAIGALGVGTFFFIRYKRRHAARNKKTPT